MCRLCGTWQGGGKRRLRHFSWQAFWFVTSGEQQVELIALMMAQFHQCVPSSQHTQYAGAGKAEWNKCLLINWTIWSDFSARFYNNKNNPSVILRLIRGGSHCPVDVWYRSRVQLLLPWFPIFTQQHLSCSVFQVPFRLCSHSAGFKPPALMLTATN